MKSKLLQLNNSSWWVSALGEQALLLKPKQDNVSLQLIHESCRIIGESSIPGVLDIIPAYESIAIIYDRVLNDLDSEIDILSKAFLNISAVNHSPQKHVIPVCYELGLDWEEVENHTGIEKDRIIQIHLAGAYTVAMMGFLPGFLYLSGLDEEIACSRRQEPRSQIPAGAVGIGGKQTGVYSLESPGGWQIIGRTPISFFDARKDPPTVVRAGDQVVFERIPEKEFSKLKDREI
ncbi:5-oxoprolinase subunit PxpB [Gracilimonas sediminicola]|uniref:5-oxoprolinase subunit PxpB n=1 Tax=Gracilimonas sediminicola TaxID=2952158 RepID=UPI0038D4C5BC